MYIFTVKLVDTFMQARWKQIRVAPAKLGSNAEGVSTLGSPGTWSPGKFLSIVSASCR